MKDYFAGLRIEWCFIVEKAPWWGGFYERLVGSVKRCLKKIVGSAKLTLDELQTVVIEVEATLNSRPLMYSAADDIQEPLTPAHLLTGHHLLGLPDSQLLAAQYMYVDFMISNDHSGVTR